MSSARSSRAGSRPRLFLGARARGCQLAVGATVAVLVGDLSSPCGSCARGSCRRSSRRCRRGSIRTSLQHAQLDRGADPRRSRARRSDDAAAVGAVPLHAAGPAAGAGHARGGNGHRPGLPRDRAGAARGSADIRVDIDAALLELRVPALMLQPLVENAIKHGIAESVGRRNGRVRGWREGGRVHLTVTNTGVDEQHAGTGEGLDSVRRRLRATFGATPTSAHGRRRLDRGTTHLRGARDVFRSRKSGMTRARRDRGRRATGAEAAAAAAGRHAASRLSARRATGGGVPAHQRSSRTSCSSTCRCPACPASTCWAARASGRGDLRHRARRVRGARVRGAGGRLPAEAGRAGAARARPRAVPTHAAGPAGPERSVSSACLPPSNARAGPRAIAVRRGAKVILVEPAAILFCRAEDKYTVLYTAEGEHIVDRTIEELGRRSIRRRSCASTAARSSTSRSSGT